METLPDELKIVDEKCEEIAAKTHACIERWNAYAKEHGCLPMEPMNWHSAILHLFQDVPYGAEDREDWSEEWANLVERATDYYEDDLDELEEVIIKLERLRNAVALLKNEKESSSE